MGWWVTGGTAEANATQRADSAVVAALAPACADKFKNTIDAAANLMALKKIDSWSQGEYVEKGGWAALPGSTAPAQISAVAKACATLLTA